jgi:hypothetical protein
MADDHGSSRGANPARPPVGGELAKTSGSGTPRPEDLRASHADRDHVVEQLRVAAGDGRLSSEELDERLELALSARTYADLVPLTADLPAAPVAGLASPAAGQLTGRAAPKDLMKIDCGTGHSRRDGSWVVPRRMEVKVTSGHVVLDFTKAIISEPVLELAAEVRSGHLQIITRPGISVDAGEVTVRSGHVSVRAPWDGNVPVQLHIDVTGRVRSGHLSARPPRRSFWQWLRRAPRPYAITA